MGGRENRKDIDEFSLPTVVVAPAYTRLDGSASYEFPGSRFTIGLFAQNLTNRRYLTSGSGAVFFAGPPRRLAIQLTSMF
jgi:outer membrane receptor protein involved in Fe transport